MAYKEGFVKEDLVNGNHALLQMAYYTPTFYVGRRPEIEHTETPFVFEVVSEVRQGDLLCYGTRGLPNMIAMTFHELGQLLYYNRSFLFPFGGTSKVLTEREIQKLKNLTTEVRPDDDVEVLGRRQELHRAIVFVEVLTADISCKFRALLVAYEEGAEHQGAIRTAVEALFRIAMDMRGWMGSVPYPSKWPSVTTPMRWR